MNPFPTLSPDDGVALLLALAFKGSLLFLLAFLVTGLLRRTSAAVRHAVWTLALGAALLLPVLFATVPGWQVPVLPGTSARSFVVVAPEAPLAPLAPGAPAPPSVHVAPAPTAPAAPAPAALPRTAIERYAASGIERLGGLPGAVETLRSTVLSLLPPVLRSWQSWLLIVWVVGLGVVALRWCCAVIGAWRLVQDAEPVYDLDWLELKERIAYDLDLDQPVRLLRSDRLGVPVAGGVFDPVVVLPADADTWPEARREVVLTHELAHIIRRDCLTQSLAQGTLALHWFNPLAWLAYRQFLLEREHACDDYVLDHGTRASDYAEHLIQIARRFHREPLALSATAPMARRSNLEDRITSILNPARRRGTLGRVPLVLASALMLTFVLPLAAFQPVEEKPDWTEMRFASVAPASAEVFATRPFTLSFAFSTDETFEWEGSVRDGGFVEIRGVNGAIRARTGPGDRVRVEAVKKSNRGQEGEVEIVVNEVADGVVVCAVYPDQHGACEPGEGMQGDTRDNDVQVIFDVVVPESVRFVGHTINGDVKTEPLGADVTVRTVNGSIRTASRRGDVNAATVNGSIEAEAAGLVRAETVNGSIDARLGRAGWSGDLSFATVNGSITLDLPATLSTTVEARTRTGSIHSDFPLRIQRNGFVGVEAEGTIGSGGRSLNLEVLNGSIHLQRTDGAFGSRLDRERLMHDQARIRAIHEHVARQAHRDTLEVVRLAEQQARVAMLQAERMLQHLGPQLAQALDEAELAEVEADIEEAMADLHAELADNEDIAAEIEAALREAEVEMEAAMREAEREMEQAIEEMERARKECEEAYPHRRCG